MYIRRDYSEPFFTGRRRKKKRPIGRYILIVALISGGILLFSYLNMDRLQMTALQMLEMAPTPTPFPSELATRATQLAAVGDLDGAAVLFEQAVNQRPDNIDYKYEYGLLLLDIGEYAQVEALGDEIIALSLVDPRGYSLKSAALVLDGSATAAIPVALNGIELAPDFAPLYATLSRAYIDTSRYEDGLDTGLLAVELAPFDADAYRAYAYALNWNGLNAQATEQLERAVTVDPSRIPAYFELAGQYLAVNRDQEAIDVYNQIRAVQPRNARASLRLCLAYRKIGQFDQALGFCEDSVRFDDTDPEAQFWLGFLQYQNRQFDVALDSFTACVANDPGGQNWTTLECTYRMGLSEFYLGDCEAAWPILRDSLMMARSTTRDGIDRIVENISAGMLAVSDTCPEYRGLTSPLIPEEDAPAADITPTPDASTTQPGA